MQNRSKSTLFLMEQVIVIVVFAICASVCVKMFVDSYLLTVGSKDKTGALIAAGSCAECYKATGGDLEKTVTFLGGTMADQADSLVVYYDKKWQVCGKNTAAYVLNLTKLPPVPEAASLVYGNILVSKTAGGEIVSFTVAARGNPYE